MLPSECLDFVKKGDAPLQEQSAEVATAHS